MRVGGWEEKKVKQQQKNKNKTLLLDLEKPNKWILHICLNIDTMPGTRVYIH